MFGTRLTRERMRSTWTACPGCQSCPPQRLRRPCPGNSSSSLCSLHLSLHLRRSLRVSVLPPVSLHDRSDRSLSGLRLSVHSPQETPSPPYSPTSASRSSEAQPQPQQQGPPRLCSDAATYPMYLIIRTQSSRFNSTRTIDIYGRGVLSVKNINFAKSLF